MASPAGDHGKPPSKRLTDAYGQIFMLALLVCGILVFLGVEWLGSLLGDRLPTWLSITLEQLAGILIATGILSVFWDVWGRRALSAEVMDTADLANEVRQAGLAHVWDRYLSDETWQQRFQRARRIDVFVAYANTWRENNRSSIAAFARRRGTQIRIILPDVDDVATMDAIALRSRKTRSDVVKKVEEAVVKYKDILADGTNCYILGHAGPQTYAAYRFDDECILTLYKNYPKKTGSIPTFVIAGGTLGEFVKEDLDQVAKASRVMWSSA